MLQRVYALLSYRETLSGMDAESQLDTSAALNAELAAAEASAREKAANARMRAEAARAAMICADTAVEAALKAADAAAEARKANIAKAAKKEAAAREAADAEANKLAKKTRRRERKERLRQEEEQRQQQDKERKELLQQEEERRQQQDKELKERLQQEEKRRQQHEDESMGIACNSMVYGDTEHERLKRAEALKKGEVRRRAERVHAALQCERSKQESTKHRHKKLPNVVQGSEHKQHNIIMYYQDPSAMTIGCHGFIARDDHEHYEHHVKSWEIKQAHERGRSERSNELKALCKRTEARWREQELVENSRTAEGLSEDEKLRRGNLLFKKSLDDARQSLLERREAQCEVMIARIEAERQAALRDIASYQAKIRALEKAALKNTRRKEGKHREKRREGRPEISWQEKSTAENSLMHAPNDKTFVREAGGEHEHSETLLETSRRKTKYAIETMIRGLVTLEDELRRERVTLQERASYEHLPTSMGGTSTEPSHNRDSNPAVPNPKSEVAEVNYKATEAVNFDEGHHGRNSAKFTISGLNGCSESENIEDVLQEIDVEKLKKEPGLIRATEPFDDVVGDVTSANLVVSMDTNALKSIDADEVDVSTASSNTTASDVTTEQEVHEFAVGDSVEVRDDLNEEWAPGIVLGLDDSGTPEVQKDGYETAYTWTYCQRRAHGLDDTSKSEEKRSNSTVPTKGVSSIEFIPGDKVEVRDDSDEDWEPGTVLSLDEDGIPEVKKDGYDSAYTWTFCRHFTQGQQPSSTVDESGSGSMKDGAASSEATKCSESYNEELVTDARPGLDAGDDDGSHSSEKSASNDTTSSTESNKSSTPPPPAPDAFTSPAAFPRWKANLDDDDEWESGHGGFGTGGKVVPANQRRLKSSVVDVVAVQAKSKLTPKGEMASQSNQRTLAQAELSRLEDTLKKAEENAEEAKTENKPIRVKKYLKEIETLTAQITKVRESLERMGGQTRMEGRYVAKGLETDSATSSPRTPSTPARARLVGAMKSVRAVTRLTSSSPASASAKKSSALASADVAEENVSPAVEDATMPATNDNIEPDAADDTIEVGDNLNDESKGNSPNKEKKKSRWAGLLGRVKRK